MRDGQMRLNRDSKSEWKYFHASWLYIILVAIVVRFALIFLYPAYPVSDAKTYYDSALNLLAGNGYTRGGSVSSYFPPGYPFFLASIFSVFGASVVVGQLANALLSVTTAYFMALINISLGGSKAAAAIVIFLVCFYPEQIAYTMLLATEPLALFLLVVSVYLLIHYCKTENILLLCLCGVFFGFSALTKTQVLLLAPLIVIACYPLYKDKSFISITKRVLVVVFFMLLTISPHTIRNYMIFDKFILISSNGPINLFIGNNPHSTGGYDESGMYLLKEHDPKKYAIEYIVKNPMEVLLNLPNKLNYLFNPYYGTGLQWLYFSKVRKEVSEVELNDVLAYVKNDHERDLIRSAYVKVFDNSNKYVLISDSDEVNSNVANAFLYSGNFELPSRNVRIVLKFVLFAWASMLLFFGAFFGKMKPPLHFIIALYFIFITLIFFGAFRFNYLFVPWFSIPFALWITNSFPFFGSEGK